RFLALKKKLGKTPLPSLAEASCGFTPGQTLDAMDAAVEARAKSGDTAGAAACARASLEPVLDVELLRGNTLYFQGDSVAALKAYSRVLEVEPRHPEALFSHASLVFETQGENLPAL
ncbi:hypothetical protein D7X74_42290, partial [Corallococcus sp. CA047B]